jgi:phosphoglycolate phosphatase-like HAD superfamily hydrolase
MKNLILFDIDDTLINTVLFRKIQDETLANFLKINDLEIKKNRSDYYHQLKKGSDFSVDEYLSLLAKKYNHDLKKIKEIFLNKKNIELCLYKEVPRVLTNLKKQGFSLGIFSEGYESFQLHKIASNNLLRFFDEEYLYIMRRKIDSQLLENLPSGTIIIDDKPSILSELKQFKNIVPIQITRENLTENKIVCENHINNLEELFGLLLKLNDS